MNHERLTAHLGPDLASLVADLGVRLVRAARITGLPSGVLTYATFRLDLRDGRRLKGRRLEAPADAERVATLVACVDLPGVQRVLARRGAALLEEWVTGARLDPRRPSPRHFERSGALLGAIHRAPTPAAGLPAPPGPAERLASIERGLDELVGAELLSAADRARLRAMARAHVPERPEVGIVHRDFCAENLVLGPAGTPWVVDNGTLSVDAYDLDLARTWYRWPMSGAQRRAFERGYASRRGLAPYRAHFPFWAIAVLVEATLFRHHARTRGRRGPLRRLLGLPDAPGVDGR